MKPLVGLNAIDYQQSGGQTPDLKVIKARELKKELYKLKCLKRQQKLTEAELWYEQSIHNELKQRDIF